LEYLNRENPDNPHSENHRKSRHALRLLARAREIGGDQAIDRLYLAMGEARYDQGHELDDEAMLAEALRLADLPVNLLDETRQHPALDKALESEYERAWVSGAFGVPSLYIDHSQSPYFGPVIDRVPSDQEAGELWDFVVWLSHRDYFYELKRLRV
jgi:2-hydroxychromene-2-carboxylate isomerase